MREDVIFKHILSFSDDISERCGLFPPGICLLVLLLVTDPCFHLQGSTVGFERDCGKTPPLIDFNKFCHGETNLNKPDFPWLKVYFLLFRVVGF